MKIFRLIDTFPPAPELDLEYYLDFEGQRYGFSFTVTGKYRSDLSSHIHFDEKKFKFMGPVLSEVGYSHYDETQYDRFRDRYIDNPSLELHHKTEELKAPDPILKQILSAFPERMMINIFQDY